MLKCFFFFLMFVAVKTQEPPLNEMENLNILNVEDKFGDEFKDTNVPKYSLPQEKESQEKLNGLKSEEIMEFLGSSELSSLIKKEENLESNLKKLTESKEAIMAAVGLGVAIVSAMTGLATLIINAVDTFSSSQAEIEFECPYLHHEYHKIGQKCVIISKSLMTWRRAHKFCRQRLGKLIHFNSVEELIIFRRALKKSDKVNYLLEDYAWTAMTAESPKTNKDFKWSGGKSPGELLVRDSFEDPSHCVWMGALSWSYLYHSSNCSATYRAICETIPVSNFEKNIVTKLSLMQEKINQQN